MGSLVRQAEERTRVLIVDDHTVVRIGLTELINRDSRFEVVGEADCCAKGLDLVNRLMPDIIILDTELGDVSGCSALIQIYSRHPDISIVVYSSNQDRLLVEEAFKHSVSAFVLKSSPLDALMHAMQSVDEGMEYLDPNLAACMNGQTTTSNPKDDKALLTGREQTILRMLAIGKANKEIARDLFITERTVKFHVSAILKRLQVKNRTQAVRVAADMGLLNAPGSAAKRVRAFPVAVYPRDRRVNDQLYHGERRANSSGKPQDNHQPNLDRRSGYDRRSSDRRPMPHLHLASAD